MELRNHITYIAAYSCGENNGRAFAAKHTILLILENYRNKHILLKTLKNNMLVEHIYKENVVYKKDMYGNIYDVDGYYLTSSGIREYSVFDSFFEKIITKKRKCTARNYKFGIEFKGQTYGPHGLQMTRDLEDIESE